VKVGDLVRRTIENSSISTGGTKGARGIILVVDIDMVKVANHGWWSKQFTEVISEQKIRNR